MEDHQLSPGRNLSEEATINLCVCTSWWLGLTHGGVDRIKNFTRNVSRNGVNVYLVDRSIEKSLSGLIWDKDRYQEIKDGVSYARNYPSYVRFLLPGMIKFFQEVLNLWASLLTAIKGLGLFLPDPYLIVKLFFVCRKERIDIIQFEFPSTAFSSFIVKKVTGIPLIYDAHNIESERLGSMKNASKLFVALMKRMELMSCNVSDSVFVVSENDRARLLSWGIPEKKVTVIPNSVELDKFSPAIDGCRIRDKYSLRNSFVIIFHGFLSYQPNREAAQILLDLFPSLLRKYGSVRLLLVGKNPPETSPHPNIIVTGFVENVQEYIAAADLAVVPLLSGGGTKLKMLEYMACGKAIVSTMKAAEGLDLEHEKDVLMSRYPDSEFTNLVLRSIEDSNLRKKIGTNARKKVEKLYNWEKNAKKAVGIYRNLVYKRQAWNRETYITPSLSRR